MYVCKTLFKDAGLVNTVVGFHKGRQEKKIYKGRRYIKLFTRRLERLNYIGVIR